MAEVGELTWIAEIQEIAQSKQEAESMNEGLEGLADQARETEGAMDQVGESSGSLSSKFGSLSTQSGFLSGALSLVGSGLLLLISKFGVTTAAVSTLTGAIKGLYAWLAAGGLSGILATISGYISGFIAWLAGASAGALAFAAAIGVVIGLIGVWILKITGVLDWIGELGVMLADMLPGWARDAILAVISIFAGGLALLGALIVGFMEGGLQGAIARGEEVLQIFAGAWDRLITGIMDTLNRWKEDVIDLASSLAEDFTSAITTAVTGLWNSIIPDSLTLPEITIGGQHVGVNIPHVGEVGGTLPEVSLGGDTIDFPQLQGGGMVEEGGGAILHPGEMVLPASVSQDVIAAIRALGRGGGGGGGGGGASVNIEQQVIEIGDQTFDLSELDRATLTTLADLIAEKQGDELATLIG